MRYFIFFGAALFLFGCKHSRGVNEQLTPPLMANEPSNPQASAQAFNDYIQRAPVAAISGTLYLEGDLPTPLVRVAVALFHKEAQWTEVARLTTEVGGAFSFTRSLPAGEYELRVMDSRYTGALPVTLTSAPKHDLVLMVQRNKK